MCTVCTVYCFGSWASLLVYQCGVTVRDNCVSDSIIIGPALAGVLAPLQGGGDSTQDVILRKWPFSPRGLSGIQNGGFEGYLSGCLQEDPPCNA